MWKLSAMRTHSSAIVRAVPVLVLTVLIAAVAGTTAFAAAQIGSRDIKNNSIRSGDLRNGTILKKDLRRSVRALLQRRGPRGPRGPQGPPGAYTLVTGADLNGWTRTSTHCAAGTPTGSASFVNSTPKTPPLGAGSYEIAMGADGNSFHQIRRVAVNVPLAELALLRYATYVQLTGSGGQAPYLLLDLSNGDDLFFEPVHQDNTGDALPDQGDVINNEWQMWNATEGGWWSADAGTDGPPLTTLGSYAGAHPGVIVENIRVVAGCGGGDWANFVGNVDHITINDQTYDLERL
jgi:hypothetical protein